MHILAALDQSLFATTVLERAIEMAKQQNATLTILTVTQDFIDIDEFVDTHAVMDKLLARSKSAAESYAATAKSQGVAATVVVEQGVSPADRIIDYAENQKIDLIVMGHQGAKGLGRFLIGSVAAKVVSHAPCSVLIVR